MNRLYSFFLALLLLLACTACVGRAAAPDPAPGQAAPLDAVTTQPSEPEEVPEEEPPRPAGAGGALRPGDRSRHAYGGPYL